MFNWIIHPLIFLGILTFLRPNPDRIAYWVGAVFKISCGIVMGLFYWSEGLGDTLAFHNEASTLYQLPFTDYWNALFSAEFPVFKAEARNAFFVKIISPFYWITGGNYWLVASYLSLVSFLASWRLFTTIRKHWPDLKNAALITFIFWPSAIFWTSGLLKDTLVMSVVYLLFDCCIHYYKQSQIRKREILTTAISLLLLFYLKFYLLAVISFLMAFLALNDLNKNFRLSRKTKILGGATFAVLLLFLVSQLNKNLHFNQLPQAVYDNYKSISENSAPGSSIHFDHLQPNYLGLLLSFPESLITGLFRPFIWEANLKIIVASLEHTLILIAFLTFLFKLKKIRWDLLGLLSSVYVFTLATLLPLVSPNYGSLIRYRAAFTPVLIFLLLIPFYQKSIKDRSPIN